MDMAILLHDGLARTYPTSICHVLLHDTSPAPTEIIRREPTASAEPTALASVEATAIAMPTPTATSIPTVGPTATVWPPVFDSFSLKDIRNLDSFVVTINEKNTV